MSVSIDIDFVVQVGETKINIRPQGGVANLFDAGIEFGDKEAFKFGRAQHAFICAPDIDPNKVLFIYPTDVVLSTNGQFEIIGAGRCPLCARIHTHGIGGFETRRPHCLDGYPPFHLGRQKPDTYWLLPVLAPLPEDMAHQYETESGDLILGVKLALDAEPLSYTKRQHRLHESKQGMRKNRYSREQFRMSVDAIARSGVLDNRITEILSAIPSDVRDKSRQAQGIAVARFIKSFGPGPMRKRTARACMKATRLLGRGEQVQ